MEIYLISHLMIEQAIIQDMKTIKVILFGVFLAASCWSCTPKVTGSQQIASQEKALTGTLEKLEETVWQYGSHMISNYAVKSESIDLDAYLEKRVRLTVEEIDGYPVDFGPRFFEVTEVKVL